MGALARYDEAAISENSAVVMARLSKRSADVSPAIQRRVAMDVPEVREDSALLELFAASVETNVDTVFHARRYEIPIENVEPPTAALEHARPEPSTRSRMNLR